eukprot:766969-Hanusia_phi.AAC.3
MFRHITVDGCRSLRGTFIAMMFTTMLLGCSLAVSVENHQIPLTKKPSQERGESICRHVQEASAEMQREEQQGTLRRSKSTFWIEGYKAGCMQFLQSYIPDHRDGKPLVVGIAGGSGSGKTTIMDVIVEHLGKVRRQTGNQTGRQEQDRG